MICIPHISPFGFHVILTIVNSCILHLNFKIINVCKTAMPQCSLD